LKNEDFFTANVLSIFLFFFLYIQAYLTYLSDLSLISNYHFGDYCLVGGGGGGVMLFSSKEKKIQKLRKTDKFI